MLEGIDVSEWQGSVNWREVKNDGIFFAGIKASEGVYGIDPQFWANWHYAGQAGIKRIAYHFLRPRLSGWAQANHFHKVVHDNGKFGPGDAAMVDVEVTDGQNAAAIMACVEGFVANILRFTHCGVYIYTGPGFWNPIMGAATSHIVYRCPLWCATWGPEPGLVNGWPNGPSIWQYTHEPGLYGVNGDVDRDKFLGSQQQYNLLATMGGRH